MRTILFMSVIIHGVFLHHIPHFLMHLDFFYSAGLMITIDVMAIHGCLAKIFPLSHSWATRSPSCHHPHVGNVLASSPGASENSWAIHRYPEILWICIYMYMDILWYIYECIIYIYIYSFIHLFIYIYILYLYLFI